MFFGGEVPARQNRPTEAQPGKDRTERAKQVSANRCHDAQLFDVIGKCMGYTTETPPRRELLLKRGMKFFGLSLKVPFG